MTDTNDRQHRSILRGIAHRVMLERGLVPDFPLQALAELDAIHGPATRTEESTRDLRGLLWCSIDNDDSRDLDQLSVAEAMPDGAAKILVAIADVDAVVKKQSVLDDHARQNTTSVYTAAETFPMLPEKLSTDLTSLNLESDRLAIVIEMVLAGDGSLHSSDVYAATVRSRARLAYNSVAGWLEGDAPMPQGIGAVNGLDENLRLQNRVAQKLKALRHLNGALDLETIEARPVFDGDELKDLEADKRNKAKDIIEDYMIAANGVSARYLAAKQFPSLRRVVRTPKRWDRIIELAAERGSTLPREPDSMALEQFLLAAKAADPLRFPDLSLSVIKLLGTGEYVVELPGATVAGHFGLAVRDYTHSTAPNRRYPDLIHSACSRQRWSGVPCPTRTTNWKHSPSTAPKRKTPRKKLNGRSQNPQPRCCWNQGSGSSSMPSSPARQTKAPGSVFCNRPLKKDWRAVLRAWTSATGCACNWSARMCSADLSTSREWRKQRRIAEWRRRHP